MNIEQFPYVLLLLVGIESLLSGKPFPNLSKFLLNSFSLRLLIFALSDIRDELVEPPHVGGTRHDATKHALFEF